MAVKTIMFNFASHMWPAIIVAESRICIICCSFQEYRI